MKIFNKISPLLLFAVTVLIGCAPGRKNPVSKTFHNTTAHYNAYFIANENVKAIEASLNSSYQWNYNKVLPVYIKFDTTDTKAFEDQLKEIIEKASIAIQRHPGSAWEDDAYILVGKARFYGYEFQDAVETFKYVNTHSKNDNARHEALIELMHTFIKNNEINNAIAVSDFLKREDLNKKNLKNLYLNRAYLYESREDLDKMVNNLVKAEQYIKNNKLRARINFIIGQIYQELGFDAEAYHNYKKVLRSNPSYELSFYTKLNMAQVSELANTSDSKKIRKYFKKLLSDTKNEEYKDKIYYEIGNFELKQGNLTEAIDAYKSSARTSVSNNRQKGYSYWQLGKIYYDSLKNYELAKNYYDSTISVLPKDEEAYEEIAARQSILEEFVRQINIIENNDSLLALAAMDTASLNKFLDEYIAQKNEEEAKRKEEQKKADRRNALAALNDNSGDFVPIGTEEEGTTWYFYNTSAVSKGTNDFKRVWGDRILEDNWRRRNKQATTVGLPTANNQTNSEEDQNTKTGKNNNKETDKNESSLSRESLIATIPYDSGTQANLLLEVDNAHYELGKIYHFQLDEDLNAINTFDTLLVRFPRTEHKPEVLYLLYLLSKEYDTIKQEDYKNRLLQEFSNTIYAKLIANPNYREESQAIKSKLEKLYKEAYEHYLSKNFKPAMNIVNQALKDHPNNDFSDNLALLKVLIIGKTENIYKYQFELNSFVKQYEESELVPYAEKLITASEQHQINLINSSKAKFKTNLEKKHLMVIAYENKENAATQVSQYVDAEMQLIDEAKDLRLGNLILSDKYAVILINDFPDKTNAMDFLTVYNNKSQLENQFKNLKFVKFVITNDNFNILYQTKELDSYEKFFERNYKQNQ